MDALLAQQLELLDQARSGGGGTSPLNPAPGAEAPSSGSPPDAAGGEAPREFGTAVSGLMGATDSLSFGFADEVGGFLDAIIPGGSNDTSGQETVWSSGKSFADTWAANVAKLRGEQRVASEKHKGAYITGQVAGALAIPFGAGARGALGVAKVGAAQGALYGLGSGEGTQDRLASAAEGGAIGGALGGVLGKGVELAGAGIRKLLGRGEQALVEAAPEPPLGWAAPDGSGEAVPIMRGADEATEELVPLVPKDTSDIPKPTAAEVVDGEGAKAANAAEEAASGSAISRAGLTAFQEEAEKFRASAAATPGDRALDITRAGTPEAAKAVGEFRLGNLGTGPEVVSTLRALSETLPAKAVRSDEELMTAAKYAAMDIGEDPEAVLAAAQAIAGKLGDADAAMATLRTVWAQSAKEISDIHFANIDWETAAPEMVEHAATQIRNGFLLSQQVQIAKQGLGRGLRVLSLRDSDTYLRELATQEAAPKGTFHFAPQDNLPATREQIADWLKLWGMNTDPAQQARMLAGELTIPPSGKYLRTAFANFFTANILSGVKTIALNVVGPTLINTVRNLERLSGAAIQSINPLSSTAEREAMRAVARQTAPAFLQTFGDIADAFRMGLQAAERNSTIIGGGGQVHDVKAAYGPFTDSMLGLVNADPNWKYSLGNLINIWPKAFARLNNGLDEMAKRLAYQGEGRVRFMVEAQQQGLSKADAAAYVADKMAGLYDDGGKAANEYLLSEAEKSTLTGSPGNGRDSFTGKTASYIQTLRKDIPETRFILPVFNVPANALGETMRRLPIVNLLPGFPETAKALAGELGPVAQADAHGRTLFGAAFLMAGVMMNRSSMLTGAGPQEPTDRKIWLQTHQPYSIRIGDEWVRYDKYDILGGLLAIPATIADATMYHKQDDEGHGLMFSGMGALAQWFQDKAAFRTAASLFTLGDDPTNNVGQWFERQLGTIAGGMASPAFVRTLGVDAQDPYVRMKRGWADYIKADIPFWSETLEPARNVLGEPINRAADSYGEALFPVVMAPVATWENSPVLDELDRLYQKTGYGAGADPKSFGYGFFNPKDVKLEDGRSIYDHAMQARATMKLGGQTLKQALTKVITSADYRNGVDADSGQKVTSRGDVSRAYLVRKVFDTYNARIKAEIAATSPRGKQYLTAAAAKLRDDAYLRDISVDELVSNPDLYRTRGVDPAAYSSKLTEGASGDLLEALR